MLVLHIKKNRIDNRDQLFGKCVGFRLRNFFIDRSFFSSSVYEYLNEYRRNKKRL